MEPLQQSLRTRLAALLRLDFLSAYVPLLVFAGMLAAACFYPSAYAATGKWRVEPVIYVHCYRYLQFYPSMIVSLLTCQIFEEIFRAESREFLQALGLKASVLIVARLLLWWLLLLLIEVPAILVIFKKINTQIAGTVPSVSLSVPIFHCAVALAFYMTVTVFLLAIFRKKDIPIALFMAYCVLEIKPFEVLFGKYAVFCGAFNAQDYYHYFPPNIRILCGVMGTLVIVIAVRLRLSKCWCRSIRICRRRRWTAI